MEHFIFGIKDFKKRETNHEQQNVYSNILKCLKTVICTVETNTLFKLITFIDNDL